MNIQQIEKAFPELKIIHAYPESGQKYVFRVNHDKFGLSVLKIFKAINPRTEREIDIGQQYHIKNVPKIYEVGTRLINDDENIYIIEQYIEGNSLRKELSQQLFSLERGLDLLDSLLRIAVELEKHKIVHRDIKPENIICCKNGEFYLIDFGIARLLNADSLTMTGAMVGPHTPGYGAPELFQYSKSDINIRADLFSIGVVVYEAILGKHPFILGGESVHEIWYKTATVDPQSFSIPGDKNRYLMSFLQTLMQKHVSRRPPSAIIALEWFLCIRDSLNDNK